MYLPWRTDSSHCGRLNLPIKRSSNQAISNGQRSSENKPHLSLSSASEPPPLCSPDGPSSALLQAILQLRRLRETQYNSETKASQHRIAERSGTCTILPPTLALASPADRRSNASRLERPSEPSYPQTEGRTHNFPNPNHKPVESTPASACWSRFHRCSDIPTAGPCPRANVSLLDSTRNPKLQTTTWTIIQSNHELHRNLTDFYTLPFIN